MNLTEKSLQYRARQTTGSALPPPKSGMSVDFTPKTATEILAGLREFDRRSGGSVPECTRQARQELEQQAALESAQAPVPQIKAVASASSIEHQPWFNQAVDQMVEKVKARSSSMDRKQEKQANAAEPWRPTEEDYKRWDSVRPPPLKAGSCCTPLVTNSAKASTAGCGHSTSGEPVHVQTPHGTVIWHRTGN